MPFELSNLGSSFYCLMEMYLGDQHTQYKDKHWCQTQSNRHPRMHVITNILHISLSENYIQHLKVYIICGWPTSRNNVSQGMRTMLDSERWSGSNRWYNSERQMQHNTTGITDTITGSPIQQQYGHWENKATNMWINFLDKHEWKYWKHC